VRLEYPVFGATADKVELLSGYIDFVGVQEKVAVLLDFKTDAPPRALISESHPQYVEQVRTYAQLVRPALDQCSLKAGLLFTADGIVRWLV
jgi:ATP-dependent exoDNAse (exonuclease V) beta subunit